MATVKGDVHDIGKNIVGVVLGCNNYQVIDLGVMVPCEKILETAVQEGVDLIGLSGLITPSLDEMVHVAREMRARRIQPAAVDRRRHDQRQAHGREDRAGLSASRPIHVLDASRAVGVVDGLLNPNERDAVPGPQPARNRRSWSRRTSGGNRSNWFRMPRRSPSDLPPIGQTCRSSDPRFSARALLDDYPLEELLPFIDWSPFFHGLGAEGQVSARFSTIRQSVSKRASCSPMRSECSIASSGSGCCGPAAVYGFWPSQCGRRRHRALSPTKPASRNSRASTRCGSNGNARDKRRFTPWPISSPRSTAAGPITWAAFAVTAGIGVDELVADFERRARRLSARSWSRPWPIGWPRRLPKRCTSKPASEWGYGRERETVDRRPDRENAIAASARPPAIRPAPTTPKSESCSTCSVPNRRPSIR